MTIVRGQSGFGVSCFDEVIPARVCRRCPEGAIGLRTPPRPQFVEVGEVIGRVGECPTPATGRTVGNEQNHFLLFVHHWAYSLISANGWAGFFRVMPHGGEDLVAPRLVIVYPLAIA